MRANSRAFINEHFPEFRNCLVTTSRMYEMAEKRTQNDNWWFKLSTNDLDKWDCIVFAGATDYVNGNFKVYRVPMAYIRKNLKHLSVTKGGWINIYLSFKDSKDLRHPDNLSFSEFQVS